MESPLEHGCRSRNEDKNAILERLNDVEETTNGFGTRAVGSIFEHVNFANEVRAVVKKISMMLQEASCRTGISILLCELLELTYVKDKPRRIITMSQNEFVPALCTTSRNHKHYGASVRFSLHNEDGSRDTQSSVGL